MDSQHNVGIRIGGDASGLVGASRQAAEAQKGLGDQLGKTSDQAKRAADESKRFVERLKEEAETMGRGRTEIERYRTGQLQLTDAQKKSAEASIAQITAYDRKQQALQFVARATALATAALLAYAGATAIGVKGQIDQAAALHSLSQSYGVSTQTLSSYRYQMQLAGVGQEEFALGMKTVSKNISEARGGVGDGAQLFRLLGREIESAVKSGGSIEQLLPMMADRFARFADGPNKAALAIALFGRAGEQLIPELNKGAAGFAAAAREAEQFKQVIGPDMARRADEFNTNLQRMNVLLSASKLVIATDALPALNAVIEAFVRGTREGGLFTGALEAAREAAAQGFAPSPAELQSRLARADSLITGLQSQGVKSSDTDIVGQNLRSLLQTRSSIQAQLATSQADKEAQRQARWQQDFNEQQRRLLAGEAPPLPRTGGQGDAGKQLLLELHNQLAAARGEASAFDQVMRLLTEGTQKFSVETRDAALAIAEQIDMIKREAEISRVLAEGREALAKQREEEGEQIRKAVTSWASMLQKIEQETTAIGMNEAEREKAVALRQIENEARQAAIGLSDDETARIYRLAEAKKAEVSVAIDAKAARQLARDAAEKASKEWEEEWKRTNDNISRGLTDALMRGFDSGKSFAQNFRDSLVNMFKTMVLEPTIRGVLAPVSQGLTGAAMSLFGGTANAAGGGGGGLGLLSNGMSLYNMFSGGLGSTAMNVGNALGIGVGYNAAAISSAMGIAELGLIADAGTAAASAGAMGGMGAAGAMSAVPVVGWIAAAAMLAMALSEDDSGPAQRGLQYGAPLGSTTRASDNYPNYPWQTKWGSADMWPAQQAFQTAMAGQEQSLMTRLHLSQDQISAVNAALAAGPNQQWVNAGVEHTPVEQSGAFQQIQASRLETISKTLGRSIEELTQTLSTSDAAWAQSIAQMREALQSGLDPLGYWTEKAQALRAELGSSATTLDQWRSELLGVLDNLSPEQVAQWQALGSAIDQSAQARDRQLAVEQQAREQAQRAAQEAARVAEELRRAAEERQTIGESLRSGLDALGYWTEKAQSLRTELGGSATTLDDWRREFLAVLDDGLSEEQLGRWQSLGEAIDQAAQARDRQIAIEDEARRQAEAIAQSEQRASEERARSIAGLRGSIAQQEGSLGQAVAGLPGRLGITSLEDFQRSLAISESASPMDRLAGAGQHYADTLNRARAGDLSSVLAFTSRAQDYLTIGRDAYASGSDFASIFSEVSRSTSELIQQQGQLQAAIVQSVPLSIKEAAADQIAELKRGFSAMVDELQGVRAELRRLEIA